MPNTKIVAVQPGYYFFAFLFGSAPSPESSRASSPLNNARAVVKGLGEMRTYKQVAKERDMTVEELFSA